MTASPTIAELRSICQPPSTINRANAEHWAGRIYMRRASIYATRGFLRLGLPANAVTSIAVASGVLGGAALLIPGPVGAMLAVCLIQLHLLLDCSDGEVARWRGTISIKGIYLDRVGHYFTDATLFAALGFRAAGMEANGWAILGVSAALAAVLIKAETDLVDAARASAGMTAAPDSARELVSARLGAMRRATAAIGVHRIIGAVEASLLVAVATAVDLLRGDLSATRVVLAATAGVAGIQVFLHLTSILGSRRLS